VPRLAQQLHVQAVFANHDDEPAALARDAQVLGALAHAGIMFHSHKDHVIFERREVLTQAGHPFGVFTPYKNAWLRKVEPFYLKAYPVGKYAAALAPLPPALDAPIPRLSDIDFETTNLSALPMPTGASGAQTLLEDFADRIERYDSAQAT
jgi:deoxyribodipyrimidine photo-lyase